jgi:hypothetical protein
MDLLWLRKILGSKEEEYLVEIETLKKRVEELANSSNLTYPQVRGIISYSELKGILSKYSPNVFISDNEFKVTDLSECKKFIESTKVQYKKWVKENHDCDNFSFELMGYFSESMYSYVFGIAWSNAHAFNFFVDETKQLYIVEPQTGKLIKIEEAVNNSNYYPIRLFLC